MGFILGNNSVVKNGKSDANSTSKVVIDKNTVIKKSTDSPKLNNNPAKVIFLIYKTEIGIFYFNLHEEITFVERLKKKMSFAAFA